MTAYDPATHRTVVQANGETSRKFYSVNKLLIDMGAAGMIDLRVQDVEPSEQGAIWLDISQPEQSNGVPKIYSGAAWVPLTPQLFYDHIAGGASGYVTNAEMEAYTAAGFQPLDSDLSAIAALSTTSYGRAFLAIADAPAARTAIGVVIGTDVQAYDADTAAIAALSGTGLATRTANNTWAVRSLANAAAGLTWTNPSGVAGNPTPVLANDLAAVEGLAGTGIARRTGTDTWSVGATVATAEMADGAVTYAKMQNVSATSRIICRKTPGAGAPEEGTLSEILDFIGSAAQGDLLYRGSAGWARLGAGTNGHYLKTQGAGANPAWSALTGGGDLLAANNLSDLASAAAARVNLGVRDVLTANRTYYVRTDGSDSNDGSANTSGAAFLTIQKALDVASALDSSIYNITINVAAGTYNAAQSLKPCAGSGFITVSGAGATTIIDPPAGVNHCFQAIAGGRFDLRNMKLQKSTATTGHAIFAEGGSSLIQFQGIEFGAMDGGGGAGRHIYANRGAAIAANGAYTITGAALYHFSASAGANIFCKQAVTLTGTPAFTRFADASLGGTMRVDGTYSGAATGVRYLADTNSVIWVVGGGASFLPGNSAGSVTNGGQYV
ncbi:MAG: hypothetical protein K2Y27_32140 [Xanthobacteraceae bacterium]|nr:hypothetical protein [Xanthobacteraceae bacterium]